MTLVTTFRRVRSPRPVAPAPPPSPPSATPAPHSAAVVPPVTLRQWIGVLAMVVGMFMALLDIQIVTSSLTQIQGGLSASADEISWIQTSYIIAEVVMIPLSGTLARMMSTRVLFVGATIGFTIASALCASATTLGAMIVFRVLQGFLSGAMIPTVFPVIYTVFPPRQLAVLMVIVSLILNLSSTGGPTVGGYLTDTYSWHWLFLVNIVPGIFVSATVWTLIDVDKPNWSLLKAFDLTGLVLMALFLGCFEYVLEEGERWDWFSDGTILTAALVSATAAGFFFWRVCTYHQPIVDLRAFRIRNFAMGSLYSFVVGIGLYCGTYVIPLFLAQVRGYSSLQIGLTVVVTGCTQICISPFTTIIARKIDLRVMLGIGMALFMLAMWLNATLTNQTGFWELLVPQMVRGCALMFCFLPANLISLSNLPPDVLRASAGLYNLMRNLGGAIGLAGLGTVMNLRVHFHWNRLIESVNPARPAVQHFLDVETSRFDPHFTGGGGPAAVSLLGRIVQREALVLTYNDVMLLIGSIFFIGLLMIPILKRPSAAALGSR
ncbi:MAG TPA: DHA2 family efflux MFS transporter permease subunit [Stellaceae bacterium]|nr:DHA2 family efflux MFS transporter permease subunit [Stellaceae bacterium]